MIQNYGPDQMPNPKELEANFVKTPEYKALRQQFRKMTDEIIDRPQNLAESKEQTKEAKAPPNVETKPSPAGSKPPSEEKKRPTPEEILNNRRLKKPTER